MPMLYAVYNSSTFCYCYKEESGEGTIYLVRDAMQYVGHYTEQRNLCSVTFGYNSDFLSVPLFYLTTVLPQSPR